MFDVFTKAKRSEVMSHIRSRGNKDTEVVLTKLFRRHKITGWRRHVQITGRARSPLRARRLYAKGGAHGVTRPTNDRRSLQTATLGAHKAPLQKTFRVRPDFVFPKLKLALFVDGCFWHGCSKHGTQPKGNRVFWKNKFARNRARDLLVTRTLRRSGWRVLRIWEHELARRNETRLLQRVRRVLD